MKSKSENLSDKARRDLLSAVLVHVPFDGWTSKALRQAVKDTHLPEGAEDLYFPGGPLEVIRFWAHQCDLEVMSRMDALDLSQMRIRDKVTHGVLFRLEAIGPHEEAARRAVSRLSLPNALGQGPSQVWATADVIWRALGDTSTDANYYSKRATLSAVIASSMMSWLADQSVGKEKARAFLEARIENVMQFEKAKWDFKKRTAGIPNPAELLGRVRYGGRRRRRRRY